MPKNNSEPHAGRVALVTGTTRGIRGRRGRLDHRPGHSRGSRRARSTRRPSSIEAARGRVADQLGHVDILVNNAGTFEGATWDDLDYDLWQRVMTTDLNGPMLMCKAFLPLMRGRGWGR